MNEEMHEPTSDHLHAPVLLQEALDGLEVKPGNWYIDATFGRGGHTQAILQNGGNVIAFDWDAQAILFGQEHFAKEIQEGRLILIRENFGKMAEKIREVLKNRAENENAITSLQISGILFDFGTSADQLKDQTRGFSFEGNADLDMRMDDRLGVKAKDLLAVLSEKQLAELFYTLGGEQEARKIAHAVVKRRQVQRIETTDQLVALIQLVKRDHRTHLHPATKVFQALRIAVNDEIDSIRTALPQALEVLPAGGRIVAISFHEGEDRVMKHTFKKWEENGAGKLINKEVITPGEEELAENRRARSAKLRIFEKKISEM